MAERGRPKGPEKTLISLRIDGYLLGIVDGTARAEFRQRNAQVEVLLREALTRRGQWPASRPPPEEDLPGSESE